MRLVSIFPHIGCAIAIAACCVGCGDGDTQITVKYASDYVQSTSGVSVFGVFENGRLSPEAWKDIGPTLSSALSQGTCDTAWTDNFISTSPTLASYIDEYTKDDGVTDQLLEQLAPMAKGGSILAFSVIGRRVIPGSTAGGKSSGTRNRSPMQAGGGFRGMGGGGRGMRGNGGRLPSNSTNDEDKAAGRTAYEISASLYSIRLRHSVLLVAMSYTGPDIDSALKAFTAKMRSSVPNVTCAGWNLDAHVDGNKIHELANQPVRQPEGEEPE
jgi:hypothetical protein